MLSQLVSTLKDGLDADRVLQRAMGATIEVAASRYAVDKGAQWKEGEPLKLLLAGYSGTRNTGADVRVEEMIRQFRHLFGDDHLELSLLTIDPELSRGYFRTVRQLHLPQVYPAFLAQAVHAHHGVIACEGSMFKSKFANALSTMMVGALGLAIAEGKLAVGYGGEAGAMDASLEALVREHCQSAFILTRNEESRAVLRRLGIESRAGTDTAWTFDVDRKQQARALLREGGWDGRREILVVAPISPFVWPVKPDLGRTIAHALTGAHDEARYASIYFHADGPALREKQAKYIAEMARAVKAFAKKRDLHVVIVGMEQLDRRACEALSESIGGAHVLVSDRHDMYTMVSVLREATFMLASRYHAIVTSMPAGVLSVGVTMDERIRNLMADRDQPDLALGVEDPALGDKALSALERVAEDRDSVRRGIERCVAENLVRMGEMGRHLVEHVHAKLPGLPLRDGLGRHGAPLAHLPPLSDNLTSLLERHLS